MSTIYVFDQELSNGSAALQPTDKVLVHEASTGTKKYLFGSQIAAGTPAVVATTAGATTLAVTQAAHGNRTVTLINTAPIAVTLPQATGSGTVYTFITHVAATGTASTIAVGNGTDVMVGVAWMLSTASDAVIGFKTSATSDTVSVNGTTKGGVAGDKIEVTDYKTGFYRVDCYMSPTGTYATPFSAAVS